MTAPATSAAPGLGWPLTAARPSPSGLGWPPDPAADQTADRTPDTETTKEGSA